jgi:ubiquinone/menaquinone biosynthesis C-methylase UbiE
MIDRQEIYDEIVRRISYSERGLQELREVKAEVKRLIDNQFSDTESYRGLKFVGSAETELCTKLKRDVDGVVLLRPFDKGTFRRKVRNLEDKFDNLKFTERCRLVHDHFTGTYRGFDVAIGGVDIASSPSDTLEGDLIFHPDFTKKYLKPNQGKDVLLAKMFFKNAGVYGKDVGGGFPLEQLIIHYGSFDAVVEAFAEGRPIFIDNSGKYEGEREPLVITYPYCGIKNMSSGVREEQFKRLIDYARRIREAPEFFLEDTSATFTKEFWTVRSNECDEGEEYSTPDIYLNRRENRALKNFIRKTKPKKILDIGCGNGWSTIHVRPSTQHEIFGIDFNEEAIAYARDLVATNQLEGFSFDIGDLEKLDFGDSYFDMIYSKRALSNLPSVRRQQMAISECARALRKGGFFYIQDLFMEGHQNLNKLRKKFNLPEIKKPRHANLLEDEVLREMAGEFFDLISVEDNTSPYYLVSRIIYPFLRNITGGEIKRSSMINLFGSYLPSMGNLGVNKRYVFKRK